MSLRQFAWRIFGINGLAIALALTIYHLGGRDHFGERGFITFLSTGQLLAIAWLAQQIFQTRRAAPAARDRQTALLWRVIAGGFIFLAADEFLSLHEVTDLLIHDLLGWPETPLSDRLDDVILGLYGVVGLGVLVVYRHAFKPFRPALPWLKAGFILLFFMVAVDVITNGRDLLEHFFAAGTADHLYTGLIHLEDAVKILAEAAFGVGFYAIRQQSARLAIAPYSPPRQKQTQY